MPVRKPKGFCKPRVDRGRQEQLPVLGFGSGFDEKPLLAVVLAQLQPHDGGQAEVTDFHLKGFRDSGVPYWGPE